MWRILSIGEWAEDEYYLLIFYGAGKRNRTSDLLITNQLLYRLSYPGLYYNPPVKWACDKHAMRQAMVKSRFSRVKRGDSIHFLGWWIFNGAHANNNINAIAGRAMWRLR